MADSLLKLDTFAKDSVTKAELVPARSALISLTPGITLLAGRGALAASFHPKSEYTKSLQVEEPGPS